MVANNECGDKDNSDDDDKDAKKELFVTAMFGSMMTDLRLATAGSGCQCDLCVAKKTYGMLKVLAACAVIEGLYGRPEFLAEFTEKAKEWSKKYGNYSLPNPFDSL